ncbi:MAG: hypothetical protein OXU71_03250 [Gammaproteobacteria bacterium]|nr:hypothetical protein [Gammaproteobacteria bacterium]
MLKILRNAATAAHKFALALSAGAIDGDGFAMGRGNQQPALDFFKAANDFPHLRGASLHARRGMFFEPAAQARGVLVHLATGQQKPATLTLPVSHENADVGVVAPALALALLAVAGDLGGHISSRECLI